MRQLKITNSITARSRTIDEYLQDISKYPMITPDEEPELSARIQAGDEQAYHRLVEANLRFVVSVAKQYQNRGLDLIDLINEGNIGLMKAARRFDHTRGFKFISYAVWWVRQQIMQAISDHGRIVRLPLNQVSVLGRIGKAKSSFLQENEREPTDAELAEILTVEEGKIGSIINLDTTGVSLDKTLTDDSRDTLLDIIPDEDAPQADGALEQESLQNDINTAMVVLEPRERDILKLSFGLGCAQMTMEEISELLSLTRERVRQLKMRAIRKLSIPAIRARLAQYL